MRVARARLRYMPVQEKYGVTFRYKELKSINNGPVGSRGKIGCRSEPGFFTKESIIIFQ